MGYYDLPLIDGEVFGESSQVQTVQGKNLFDKSAVELNRYVDIDGSIKELLGYSASDFIRVGADSVFTISGQSAVGYGAYYNTNKEFVSSRYMLNTEYTHANEEYLRLTINMNDLDVLQIEDGATATIYEAFVPDSPSSDYPSAVLNTPARTCRFETAHKLYTVDLPEMRGVGGYADSFDTDTFAYVQRISLDLDDCTTESIYEVGELYVLEEAITTYLDPVLVWNAPIVDRISGLYYTKDDLNRVGFDVQFLADELNAYGYAATVDVTDDWAYSDFPIVTLMETYLENVQALIDAYCVFATTPALPDSMAFLTWIKANDIEQILLDLRTALENMIAAFVYCGEPYCGEGG